MALLIIILIAFGLILGFFTRNQAFKKLGGVLIMAALVPMFISMGKDYFNQLPLEQKITFAIIILTCGIFTILRILLGKDLFNEVMGRFVYNGIKAVFEFPFRIISRLMRTYK